MAYRFWKIITRNLPTWQKSWNKSNWITRSGRLEDRGMEVVMGDEMDWIVDLDTGIGLRELKMDMMVFAPLKDVVRVKCQRPAMKCLNHLTSP